MIEFMDDHKAHDANVARRREVASRLSVNTDFAEFIGDALEEFCAFGQSYSKVDEFRQGVRAAGAWIINRLAEVKDGRDMLARLYAKHLDACNLGK